MKKVVLIFFALSFSAGMAFLFPSKGFSGVSSALNDLELSHDSFFEQSVVGVYNEPQETTLIYESGRLLGAIEDLSRIDAFLDELYHEKYEEKYPNTSLGLGVDVYLSKELSLYDYEDIDDQIIQYIDENQCYGVNVSAIEFSDSKGIYETIYVRNIDEFYNARDRFLLNFCSQETLNYVRNNKAIPELVEYGSREISVKIQETMTIIQTVASVEDILGSEQEIFDFLCYGEKNPAKEIYTTVEGDTVDGVGAKTGLTGTQVMILNSESLKSTTQLLEPGIELNIRYLEPIINVEVKTELIRREEVYPSEATVILDDTMSERQYDIVQQAENGYKNVKYIETYINGEYVSYYLDSEQITKEPINEIRVQGTMVIPGVGTGTFRWPADNPRVTCNVGCYAGHRAIDIINIYNRYGNVYAADRGTVEVVDYNSINGYYVIINHNNGLRSYYGHMNKPSPIPVGTNVDKGDVIGQIGETGRATGPHIHFFIMLEDNSRPHPCKYLGCSY